MAYEVVKEDGADRTVRFSRTADEVSGVFKKIRRDITKEVTLPGFRPGKVPDSIIGKRFGNLIIAETAEKLRQNLTVEALDELDWILADKDPEGKVELPVEGLDYQFELVFTLFETPEPTGYGNILITVPPFDADQTVEDTLQSYRERLVEFTAVDRPAADRDIVVIETVPPGSGEKEEPEDMPVRIGAEQLGPGFDEILMGQSKGNEFKARMETLSQENDSPVEIHMFKVKEIRESRLPELDDEFAKKVSGVDTLEELRQKVRKNIEQHHEDEMKYFTERQALDTILDSNPFDPPGYMVDNLYGDFLNRFEEEDPSEETKKAIREMAAKKVREFLLLRAVALKEGIKVNSGDIEKEGSPEESVSSATDRIRNRKAVEHVLSHATITEEETRETVSQNTDAEDEHGWRWVVVSDNEQAETESAAAGNEEVR